MTPKSPLPEHAVVRLLETVKEAGDTVPAGAEGTIVSVYNGGGAYAVEFVVGGNMPTVITVYASQLKALSG